jgi:hypothetical protein
MERLTLHQKLDLLIDKYEKNEYLSNKLCNYVENFLPATLEAAENDYNTREKRKQGLALGSEDFIERFMSKNRCFYCPQNELFVMYDGAHFSGFSEDNIVHKILSQITTEQHLRAWKHKIKNTLMRHIKEKSPLLAIPESVTIQSVLNKLLFPTQAIFTSRNHVKYFLTVIGDCLNNKNENPVITYFASPTIKALIREIEVQIYTFFGTTNILQNIKYKHCEHDYLSSRLLYIDEKRKPVTIDWQLSKYMLDLLCVASHYSMKYKSADNFLYQCTESALVNHALFLHKNTPETIVNKFIEESIQNCPQTSINSKNMIFIWKKFLEERNVPSIIFHGSLTTMLREKMSYDEETDSFKDVTSVYLPLVAAFLKFWDNNMEELADSEIEIEELSKIFRIESGKNVQTYSDTFLVELIKHFYPEVVLDDEKYIMNIKCKIWDKYQEVIDTLEMFKLKSCNIDNNVQINSLYNAYQFYINNHKSNLIVSKRYFDKIAHAHIGDVVDHEGIIDQSWFK